MAEKKELPEGEAAPKKKSRFKLVMILVSLLLVLGAGGGAGYWWFYLRPEAKGLGNLFSFMSSSSEQAPEQTGGGDKKESASKEAGGKGAAGQADASRTVFKPVPLPSLVVNLADPQGSRYLKISMQVEVNSPDAVQEIDAQGARIRDALILLLSSKKVQDLASPEGKILLKNEVAARLNQVLGTPRIVRIYYTEFEIQ